MVETTELEKKTLTDSELESELEARAKSAEQRLTKGDSETISEESEEITEEELARPAPDYQRSFIAIRTLCKSARTQYPRSLGQ